MTNPLASAYESIRLFIAEQKAEYKKHTDRGAGFIEYAGVLIVIGAIAAVAYSAIDGDEEGIGETIKSGISEAITEAFSEVNGF